MLLNDIQIIQNVVAEVGDLWLEVTSCESPLAALG